MRCLLAFSTALLVGIAAPQAQAEVYVWEQTATEDQVKNAGTEDGSTDSAATGDSTLTYDTETRILTYDVAWDSLENQLTKIHVHGPAGPDSSNPAHLFNVFPEETDVLASGVDRFTDSTQDEGKFKNFVLDTRSPFNHGVALSFLLQERGYVNIHSSGFPMGEIRGNLVLTGGELATDTKGHKRCTGRLNEVFDDVSAAQAQAIAKCVKRGTKGDLLGTIEACFTADSDGTIEAAVKRGTKRFEKKCHGLDGKDQPKYPFYARPAGNDPLNPTMSSVADYINRLASEGEVDLAHALFSEEPDDAIALKSVSPTVASCQRRVYKQVRGCQSRLIGDFRSCVDAGQEGGRTDELYEGADDPFDDASDVAQCLGFDRRGKIEKRCDTELDAVIAESCVGVDLEEAFPGCDEEEAFEFARCARESVRCETCEALNAVNDLGVNCDDFDDDSDNDSCPIEFDDDDDEEEEM